MSCILSQFQEQNQFDLIYFHKKALVVCDIILATISLFGEETENYYISKNLPTVCQDNIVSFFIFIVFFAKLYSKF